VEGWTAQAGLTLHPEKTRLVHAWDDGFDFLGYRFARGRHWPCRKSMGKLKDAIRAKTGRTVGQALPRVIADVNLTLRGWYGYFQHSYRPTFRMVDGWVRRRLRSILRRRRGAKGIASTHGADQTRWPNALFAKHGLFSLQDAYDAVR
jgi:RNA-directed DNA polymerase